MKLECLANCRLPRSFFGSGFNAGGRETGFDETRPVGSKPLTQTLDQHAPNLGGRGHEFEPECPAVTQRRPKASYEYRPICGNLQFYSQRT